MAPFKTTSAFCVINEPHGIAPMSKRRGVGKTCLGPQLPGTVKRESTGSSVCHRLRQCRPLSGARKLSQSVAHVKQHLTDYWLPLEVYEIEARRATNAPRSRALRADLLWPCGPLNSCKQHAKRCLQPKLGVLPEMGTRIAHDRMSVSHRPLNHSHRRG